MMSFNIGLIGATGFTGLEILKYLSRHPNFQLKFVTSERLKGQKLASIYPFLPKSIAEIEFIGIDDALNVEVDGIFSCLPHKASAEKIIPFIETYPKTKVVDLSADFRLNSLELYEEHYASHPQPALFDKAVYGLCEVHREQIKGSQIIGNPGCYPTSILLPLIPLLRSKLVNTENIIVDAKSGVSGAGKESNETTHFMNCHENFSAYKIGDEHRHLSEINEQLSLASEKDVNILFTPHLLPMARGILSTIYVDMADGVTVDQCKEQLSSFYQGSSFVRFMEDGFPKTAWVRGTNNCMFGLKGIKNSSKLVIVSVIDNLSKGASGQAIQNMNIVLGIDENLGLGY